MSEPSTTRDNEESPRATEEPAAEQSPKSQPPQHADPTSPDAAKPTPTRRVVKTTSAPRGSSYHSASQEHYAVDRRSFVPRRDPPPLTTLFGVKLDQIHAPSLRGGSGKRDMDYGRVNATTVAERKEVPAPVTSAEYGKVFSSFTETAKTAPKTSFWARSKSKRAGASQPSMRGGVVMADVAAEPVVEVVTERPIGEEAARQEKLTARLNKPKFVKKQPAKSAFRPTTSF
jgi:hypothetical protein